MPKRFAFIISAAALLIAASAHCPSKATAQGEFTLVGEWLVTSTPINDEVLSRMGNTLGFPDRDMFFEQDGSLRTGFVAREDIGGNVRPLGVWRINGDRFSATFQLWCPDATHPCGSVIMRGRFTDSGKIRGTMTVFFDERDETRPTGYDTWKFNFRGERVVREAN